MEKQLVYCYLTSISQFNEGLIHGRPSGKLQIIGMEMLQVHEFHLILKRICVFTKTSDLA